VCVSLLPVLSAKAGSLIPDTYDDEFKHAAQFMPAGSDWRLLKAQCWQESRLNPLAVSPVGAYGLCQFMPATAKDLQRYHRHLNDFWLPSVNIEAAARYMAQNLGFWSAKRSRLDRYKLALCNYNAGAGNCLKAQRLSGGKLSYDEIIAHLPKVTGHHSKETIEYVDRIIGEWYVALLFD
jgi:soluble lytic murein transglycosylase-like protein